MSLILVLILDIVCRSVWGDSSLRGCTPQEVDDCLGELYGIYQQSIHLFPFETTEQLNNIC